VLGKVARLNFAVSFPLAGESSDLPTQSRIGDLHSACSVQPPAGLNTACFLGV